MLTKARPLSGRGLRFEEGDIGTFDPPGAFGLVFSNAAFHWVPDHPGPVEASRPRSGPERPARLPVAGQLRLSLAHRRGRNRAGRSRSPCRRSFTRASSSTTGSGSSPSFPTSAPSSSRSSGSWPGRRSEAASLPFEVLDGVGKGIWLSRQALEGGDEVADRHLLLLALRPTNHPEGL